MPWQELTFQTNAEYANQLAELFTEAGAAAVTFLDAKDQPIYEPELGTQPLWKLVQMSVLFEMGIDLSEVLQFCKQSTYITEPNIGIIEDREWERVWMAEFKPMRFGNRLWICPSWCEPPDPTAINILLDPGLAFGTGTHPTTAMCLEALDNMDLTNKTVIDYGCGSGILGIAAMKLRASSVSLVDNDPQALTATRDNAEKNNIDLANFHIEHSDVFKEYQVDIVLANILANPLIQLSEKLMSIAKHHIVLSGILEEQAAAVIQAYQKHFNFMPIKRRDGWVCLEGTRNH